MHYIPAFVRPQDFEHLLQTSPSLRRDLELSLTDANIRPRITSGDIKIQCLQGKHRVKAAEKFLPPNDWWWTVELSVLDETSSDAANSIRKEVQRFSHETKLSDGEIYRLVRFYENNGQHDLAQECLTLYLTPSKRKNLKQLLKRTKKRDNDEDNYVELLDSLLAYPGLSAGLELGNFRKHLALHCDRELLHYLEHVRKTWESITGGDVRVRQAVDIETVRLLEMLAPATSIVDRNFISREMRSGGRLFPSIHDNTLRQSIKSNLLGLPVMIPTIASFHENTNYLRIGVNIIRNHLLNQNSQPSLKKKDLYEAMKAIWTSYEPVIEVQDEFSPIEISSDAHLNMDYIQVFLSALRSFSKLGDDGPKKESGTAAERGSLDMKYLIQFLKSVTRFGFTNDKIPKTLREHESLGFPAPCEQSSENFDAAQEVLKRRWNRPFSKQYSEIRCRLFLPEMLQALLETDMGPSVLFIQYDFMNAFFDMSSINDPGFLASLLDRSSVQQQRNEEDTSQELNVPQILTTNETLEDDSG
ncbi:hypothetical protein B0J14DRAFT_678379 [Halenospora varia]|nr:hypothetical protein B0J14DRAFT_678379 [Halenospora varia]